MELCGWVVRASEFRTGRVHQRPEKKDAIHITKKATTRQGPKSSCRFGYAFYGIESVVNMKGMKQMKNMKNRRTRSLCNGVNKRLYCATNL